MTEQGSDEYGASIGAVMAARARYERTCSLEGADSPAAQAEYDELSHALAHRNDLRVLHDAALDHPRGS